jgi:YaiO family outer membrane protein
MRRLLRVLVIAVATSGIGSAAEVEVGYGHESLTRGTPWDELGLTVAWGEPGTQRLDLGARALDRFGVRDTEFRAAGSTPLAERWVVGAEASGSPEHRFMPRVAGGASLQRALGSGFVASGGVRGSVYDGDAGVVRTGVGSLGLERYWGAFRLGWTGYLATLHARWSASNALAADVYYGQDSRAGVRVSGGRELETTGAGEPIVSTVVAAGLAGRQHLGGDWSLTWEAGVLRQGSLYTRTGARVGIRRHF